MFLNIGMVMFGSVLYCLVAIICMMLGYTPVNSETIVLIFLSCLGGGLIVSIILLWDDVKNITE